MDIYKETIIHNFQHPQNFGKPEKFTHSLKLQNLSCGDEIEVFLNVVGDQIQDINYVAEGCAISIASASILSQELKGKTLEVLKTLDEQYALEILGIELTPTRVKCAHLPLDAIQQALTSPAS